MEVLVAQLFSPYNILSEHGLEISEAELETLQAVYRRFFEALSTPTGPTRALAVPLDHLYLVACDSQYYVVDRKFT